MKYRKIIGLVLVWLFIINVFAVVSLNRFNLKSDNAYRWVDNGRYDQGQTWDIVALHSRWDSNWYLDIVRHGYLVRETDTLSNIVFFPLYPLSIKIFSFITSGDLILAGWLVSVVFLFGAALFLFRLAREFHSETDPWFSVFLLLIFPTAFFLNAVYTESMFLFFSIASFFYTRRQNYVLAGMMGLLASLTRITGVLLFLPLLLQLFLEQGINRRSLFKALPLAMVPIGTISFFIYHWLRFGNFLLFFRVENAWGRSFNFNAEHFLLETRAATANFSLDVFYLCLVIVIAAVLFRRRHYSYVLYVVLTVLVAISTGTLMSIGRYILVLFPIYLVGSSIRDETARYIWVMASVLLLALNTILFVNWYWAG